MRIHFREYRVELRELDKHMINAALFAHYKAAVLALVQGGRDADEADKEAIRSVDAYAKTAFPDLTIDVLPEADQ